MSTKFAFAHNILIHFRCFFSQYGPRFNWTAADQSLLLGSYFWGYLFTALPGGMLAERFGGRSVVGWSLASSAVLTAGVPVAASWSFWAVFALRFLTGVSGVSVLTFPTDQCDVLFGKLQIQRTY